MHISITPETAYDLGAIKDLTEQSIIRAIREEYSEELSPYFIEVNEVNLGVDTNSVYHMESGIILEWFDVDDIHEKLSEEFSLPSVYWRDKNGDIEEG